MRYCPACGGALPVRQARYCPECGVDLSVYRPGTAGAAGSDPGGGDRDGDDGGRRSDRGGGSRRRDPDERTHRNDPDERTHRNDPGERTYRNDPDERTHRSDATARTDRTGPADGPSPVARVRDRLRALPVGRGVAGGAGTFLAAYALTYLGFVVDRALLHGAGTGAATGPTATTALSVGRAEVTVAAWELVGWLCYGGLTVPLGATDGSTVAVFELAGVAGRVTPLLYAGLVGLAVVGGGAWVARGTGSTTDGEQSAPAAAAAGATVAAGFVPLALAGTFLCEAGNVGPALTATALYATEVAVVGGAVGGVLGAVVARTSGGDGDADREPGAPGDGRPEGRVDPR